MLAAVDRLPFGGESRRWIQRRNRTKMERRGGEIGGIGGEEEDMEEVRRTMPHMRTREQGARRRNLSGSSPTSVGMGRSAWIEVFLPLLLPALLLLPHGRETGRAPPVFIWQGRYIRACAVAVYLARACAASALGWRRLVRAV